MRFLASQPILEWHLHKKKIVSSWILVHQYYLVVSFILCRNNCPMFHFKEVVSFMSMGSNQTFLMKDSRWPRYAVGEAITVGKQDSIGILNQINYYYTSLTALPITWATILLPNRMRHFCGECKRLLLLFVVADLVQFS